MKRQYKTTERQRLAVRRYQKNHPEKYAENLADFLTILTWDAERRYNARAGREEDAFIRTLSLGTIEPDSY